MSLVLIVLALPLLIGAFLKGNALQSLWFRLGVVMVGIGVAFRLFGL